MQSSSTASHPGLLDPGMRTFPLRVPTIGPMETIEEQPRPSWTSWAWPTAFALVTVLFSLLPMLPGGEAFNRPMVLAAYLAVFVLLVAGVLVWAFLPGARQSCFYGAVTRRVASDGS